MCGVAIVVGCIARSVLRLCLFVVALCGVCGVVSFWYYACWVFVCCLMMVVTLLCVLSSQFNLRLLSSLLYCVGSCYATVCVRSVLYM